MKKLMVMMSIVAVVCSVMVSDVYAGRGDKIGLVNVQRIWREYKGMQAVEEKIKKITLEKRVEVNQKQSEIAQLREDYESKSVILSDAEKEKKSEEIDQKIRGLQEFMMATNKELQKVDMELKGEVIRKVKEVVESYGKKKGFDLILNNTEAIVLYTNDSFDITDEILKRLEA